MSGRSPPEQQGSRIARALGLGALLLALLAGFWTLRGRLDSRPAPSPVARERIESSPLSRGPPRELPPSCPAVEPPLAFPTPGERREAAERFAAGTQASIVGNAAQARDLYRQSAALDPTSADAVYRLGRTSEELQDSAEALRQYCLFLLLGSDAADIGDVRTRIARLASAAEPRVPEVAAEVAVGGDTAEIAPPAPERADDSRVEPVAAAPPLRRTETEPAPPPVAAPAVAAAPDPVLEQPATAPPPTLSGPTEAEAIRSAVQTYARAIESRDVTRLRGAYPGLTREQERAWQEFFESAEGLSVELAVERIETDGDEARVRVAGTYRYRNRTLGGTERAPVLFEATLARRSEGEWRIVVVR